MMNILNGGSHADTKRRRAGVHGAPLGRDLLRRGPALGRRGVPRAEEDFEEVKKLATGVGDEGGYAPDLASNEEALKLIMEAISAAGFKAGEQISLCLDVAASEFYDSGAKKYKPSRPTASSLDSAGIVNWYAELAEKYPIVSIEDGCAEDDWDGWKMLSDEAGQEGAAGGRRPVRHQRHPPQARHRPGHRQLHLGEGEPDRQPV
jgi:enolase